MTLCEKTDFNIYSQLFFVENTIFFYQLLNTMNYKDFEQHISEIILSRGKNYFDAGAVEDLVKEDGHWLANVHGSEIYEVAIKGIRSIKEWDCDCPYDQGPICKHVVAVLYAVRAESINTKSTKTKKAKNQVDEIFKNAKQEDLLKFFKKNLRYHKDLKQKFLSEFLHLLDAGDKDRYNKVVDSLIKNTGGRYGYIEYRAGKKLSNAFNNLLSQAESAGQKKNYLDALDISAAIILKVPNLLLTVDDSSGALQGSCQYALNILENLLVSPVIPPIFKDQIFDFMLDAFQKDKTDFDFKDDMLATLLEQNLDSSRLKQIQKVVQKTFDSLEGNYTGYSQELYVSILIDIAQRIGNEEESENLITRYIHFPRIRQMKLEVLFEKEDYESAKQLIAEGIKIAEEKRHPGTVTQWKNVLIKISRLEKDVEEERRLLREVFFNNYRNMDYLLQLKDTFDLKNWIEEREKVILQIIGKSKIPNYNTTHTLAQIYVEEQLWERLLDLLHTKKISSHTLEQYGFHLHKKFPEEMLTLYRTMIIHQAAQANSRSHYKQVANKLKDLLKIKGGRDLVIELLEIFRAQYIRRPAMIDELSRVL